MKRLQGEWPDHVRAWRASGDTARAYCAAHGLNVNRLWSWSARMQDEKKAARKIAKSGAGIRMALVRPTRPTVTATSVTRGTGVRLSVGAVRVEVERGFDEETLSRVLAVLERPEVVR
ncbi:MAG: hypothetical protein H6726_12120 [Sandaracinaceae bacterium]|nr:hypothetical protein [Sandaracinaceae bacterium]